MSSERHLRDGFNSAVSDASTRFAVCGNRPLKIGQAGVVSRVTYGTSVVQRNLLWRCGRDWGGRSGHDSFASHVVGVSAPFFWVIHPVQQRRGHSAHRIWHVLQQYDSIDLFPAVCTECVRSAVSKSAGRGSEPRTTNNIRAYEYSLYSMLAVVRYSLLCLQVVPCKHR